MNTADTQLDFELQERPITDVQRWSRLIPEHFHREIQRHGWSQLPLEELHSELKINGTNPIIEDLIARLCATESRYDDMDNIRLGRVFLGDEWLPKNPRVKLTPELFTRLENIFVKLGCVHLYDIWIMGRVEHVATVEKDPDVLELWEYLYEYASEVIVANGKNESEEENQSEVAADEEWCAYMELKEREKLREDGKKKENQVTHVRHANTHTHNISNDNRRGIGFWKMSFALAVTALLSGGAVKRGYVNFENVERDIVKIIELVHPDDAPKAIQVTPDQMREIEAGEKQ